MQGTPSQGNWALDTQLGALPGKPALLSVENLEMKAGLDEGLEKKKAP